MIRIGEDKTTIYINRQETTNGEFSRLAFYFPIYNAVTKEEEKYMFKLDDVITFEVIDKKGYTKNEIIKKEYTLKDLGYVEPTEIVEIPLTSEDTKLFPLKNKTATYWYEIYLNHTTTILGFDNDGAKKIIVYPSDKE